MRVLVVALLLLGALGTACGSGGDEGPVDKDEYLRQFVELTELTTPVSPPGDDSARIFKARVDLIERMEPPAELSVEHKAAAEAWLRINELVQLYQREGDASGPSILTEIDDLSDVIERWSEAVKAHFGVWIGNVTGASMEPAFCVGAPIVARVPSSLSIERWSTIVFDYPEDTERDFIKRVVGLPGETISVAPGGQILIDGEPVAGDIYAMMPANYTVEPLTIPPDRYYVLGDNRRNSFDSHAWYAGSSERIEIASTVPRDHILGVLPADTVSCPKDDTLEAGD